MVNNPIKQHSTGISLTENEVRQLCRIKYHCPKYCQECPSAIYVMNPEDKDLLKEIRLKEMQIATDYGHLYR